MANNLIGRILITGGTGSLGTAILERAHKEGWSCEFTVLARNETRMAQVKTKYPNVRCEIGDVRDKDWLSTIAPGHDICIHAAAIKQVPTAESNVREAMLTNVIGSQNVAMACVEGGVKRVIGISTDKACQPTTQYGCTKYLMEGLFREADAWSPSTRFILVRYGNVLRSNASVLPLFEKQIAEDIPFTITDLRMTRFWLSMPQAIDLVLDAAYWQPTGVILVPKPWSMGMVDLAKALDTHREIVEIGIRPGEKVHEMLINSSEAMHTLDVEKYFEVHSPQEKLPAGDCLPSGFEYCSNSDLVPRMAFADLYRMLDEYNPYGGKTWNISQPH